MSDEADREEQIEQARRIFAGSITFLRSAPSLKFLPDPIVKEVAFAGRSNVGKSSLLNALTNRNGLARTSNTPGRTQEINFFDLGYRRYEWKCNSRNTASMTSYRLAGISRYAMASRRPCSSVSAQAASCVLAVMVGSSSRLSNSCPLYRTLYTAASMSNKPTPRPPAAEPPRVGDALAALREQQQLSLVIL